MGVKRRGCGARGRCGEVIGGSHRISRQWSGYVLPPGIGCGSRTRVWKGTESFRQPGYQTKELCSSLIERPVNDTGRGMPLRRIADPRVARTGSDMMQMRCGRPVKTALFAWTSISELRATYENVPLKI